MGKCLVRGLPGGESREMTQTKACPPAPGPLEEYAARFDDLFTHVASALAAGAAVTVILSESCWDPDQVNKRRLRLLLADPATAAHAGGVLVIDDSGDRNDGTATAFVGLQWLGRIGKTDNGVVTVTT